MSIPRAEPHGVEGRLQVVVETLYTDMTVIVPTQHPVQWVPEVLSNMKLTVTYIQCRV